MTETVTLTVRLRLRDKHAAELNRQARAVNFVWNYCNETQRHAAAWGRKWLTGYDLTALTGRSSKELNLNGQTIGQVCLRYARARVSSRRPWLRWRGRKSLGWIPFNGHALSFRDGAFVFASHRYEPMHFRSEVAAGARFGCGSFSSDARGRWYINVPVRTQCALGAPVSHVGIDLGLKALATLSTGETIEAPRLFRASEVRLATAQRARKTKRARAIHAKVAARRKDFLHKASAKIAKEHGLIVIGDISPKKIAQTRFAKSSLDAGWSDFKRMLSYKSIRNGGSTLEVSERNSSRTCSACGACGGPKGIAGLGIREWCCDDCGAVLDRDVNAARNILRAGLCALAEGAAKKRSSQPSRTGRQPTAPAADREGDRDG